MGFNALKSRLQSLDAKYQGIMPNSVLGHLLTQIGNEIDTVKSLVQGTYTNQPDYDLLEQHDKELDIIAELVGMARLANTQFEEGFVIPAQISISVNDISQSILTVLQTVYGNQDNFPTRIYVQYNDLVLAALPDYSNLTALEQSTIVLPQEIVTVSNVLVPKDTKLTFTYDTDILNDYLSAKSTKTIDVLVNYESDEALKLRIATALQNRFGPTTSWLESAVYSSTYDIRFVKVKNFARGLQTADVIIFPKISAIYNEDQMLITNIQLAEQVAQNLSQQLPLGVDILFKNAEQIVLNIDVNIEIYASEQDSEDSITQSLRTTIINYLNSLEIGTEQSLDVADITSEIKRAFASVWPSALITSLQVKDQIGNVLSTIDIKEDQYPVLNNLNVTYTTI